MKRLIKKSDITPQVKQDAEIDEIEQIEENPDDLGGLIPLDELSEADVRHERCPICKHNPISRHDGFKQCPSCQTVFKMLDGKGYMVSK